MINVRRISHATFESSDVERQSAYYTELMGLAVTHKDQGKVIHCGPAGQEVIAFEKGSSTRCKRISFQIAPDHDLKDIGASLQRQNIEFDTQSDTTPFVQQALVFSDPKGTEVELFREHSPVSIPPARGGISPMKLGHIAFSVQSAQTMADFYGQNLGFRVSDWIEDKFVFLRCGPDHHTLNFLNGDTTFMHHIAFELKDWAHLLAACDTLGRANQPIIWGPGRHRVGHNIFVYFRDPDDLVIELYTELDLMKEEELGAWDPRPWHKTNPQRPAVWSRADAAPVWGMQPSDDFRRNGNDHFKAK